MNISQRLKEYARLLADNAALMQVGKRRTALMSKKSGQSAAFILLTVVLAFGLFACSGGGGGGGNSTPIVSLNGIALDETNLTLDGGTSRQLVVTFDPEEATNKNVTWTSSNEPAVEVSQDGTIKVVGCDDLDTATITATSEDGGFTATCDVTISVNRVTGVSFAPNIVGCDIYKWKGGVKLEPRFKAVDSTKDPTYKTGTWTSSHDDIATVDENGLVKFANDNLWDEVEITFETYDGGHKATCRVMMIEPPKTEPVTDENGNPTGFVKIGPCSMPLGADASYKVTLTKPYVVSDHEVTQKEFKDVTGVNPSECNKGQENYPVEKVSWFMAIAYCNKLSIDEGLDPCYTVQGVNWGSLNVGDRTQIPYSDTEYPDLYSKWQAVTCDFTANGYRLPTEAEWEIAARGDLLGEVYAGTAIRDELKEYAWYASNAQLKDLTTGQVKQKLPNAYGLYDMSGNVWEWCWEWYDNTNKTLSGEATDPNTPLTSTATVKINRGGSWTHNHDRSYASNRNFDSSFGRANRLGFRVVRTVTTP